MKIKKADIPDIGINPFVNQSFVINTKQTTFTKEFVPDKGDCKIFLPKVSYSEADRNGRYFISADIRSMLVNLPPAAGRLYLWIQQSIGYGCDYIAINQKKFMEVATVTRQTYAKGVNDLIRYGVMCESAKKGVFFINPRLFFIGSRPNKWPDHKNITFEREI